MGAAERGRAGGAGPRALLAPAGQAQPIAAAEQLEAGAHHPLQGGGAGAHQRRVGVPGSAGGSGNAGGKSLGMVILEKKKGEW